jgi:hypothetical protein
MGVAMIMHDENAFYGTSHSKVFMVVLETLETGGDAGVFFWLGLFCAVKKGLRMRMTFEGDMVCLKVKLERGYLRGG